MWPGATPGATSLLLEEREMGSRSPTDGRGGAGLLGNVRVPQLRGPMARAALQRLLPRRRGRAATRLQESPSVYTLVHDLQHPLGHVPARAAALRLPAVTA